MEYRYIGKLPDGLALLFNDIDMANVQGVELYFELTEPIPDGEGLLYTDGVSKIWYEKEPEIEPPVEPPKEVTIEELAAENKLLKAQLQAQTDRSDFIEDCIAEMATQVYGGV